MSGAISKADFRATPSSSTSKHPDKTGTIGASSPKTSDSQSLLTPVIRSKRTPIACTECRRRQVKCTGGTPRCERCQKRGVKCEYIPCSQQKAASSTGSPTPPALSERQVENTMPFYAAQSSQSGSTPWQQVGNTFSDYFHDGRTSYEQRNDWQHQAYGPIASDEQMAQSYFNGVPAHQRITGPVTFNTDAYNSSPYSYHTHGHADFQSTVPSHQSYTSGPIPSGYVTADAYLQSGDHLQSFGYGQGHGRRSLLDDGPSHRSPYPAQLAQGGNAPYNPHSVGVPSDFLDQDWTAVKFCICEPSGGRASSLTRHARPSFMTSCFFIL
ncbi:hypothetical protein BDY19DRAFT_492985 [Irpex rosettiformis]|uniref:Uncharacterized protein n=1 Tax=Irpex rosettiformis TaxID=378272 RepID=A0ACB8UE04_9APHY|nr:hypothetical protein BDY19DRAFT_492985 [Irpex rosettiformis]